MATFQRLWRFDGPELFVCTPLVLIKIISLIVEWGVQLLGIQVEFLGFKYMSHVIARAWSLHTIEAFTCTPIVVFKLVWLAIQELFRRIKSYLWMVYVLWGVTLDSVESFSCTPLVVAKLVWLFIYALLRILGSALLTCFQCIRNIICTFVTLVGGCTEWIIIFTNILLEEHAWTCAFKTCFIWGFWMLFRRMLWKPHWSKVIRAASSRPCMVENERKKRLTDAKDTVRHTEILAKEVSATIDQHLNGQWWSCRSIRCIIIILIAVSLTWLSSFYSKLPWVRHLSTASEVCFVILFVFGFVLDFKKAHIFICIFAICRFIM